MLNKEKQPVFFVLVMWTALVFSLFLHASGKVNLPFFHFPQAKGLLLLIEEGYKKYNLVGLREEVYAVPQSYRFLHPSRTKKMKKNGIFVAHSVEEAKRMIDAGTEEIDHRLVLLEKNYHGKNLYTFNDRIAVVPSMDEETGAPLPGPNPYAEQVAGSTVEEAKQFIQKHNSSSQ